jgi:hypothetical protein
MRVLDLYVFIFRHKSNVVPFNGSQDKSEQTTRNVRASPQQRVREEHKVDLSIGEGVIQFPLHFLARSSVRVVGLPWNVETGLGLLLRALVHCLKRITDCIQVQEFQVIQAIVLSVVLVEVATNKVGGMNKARVNEI